jgi:hypothetical protein
LPASPTIFAVKGAGISSSWRTQSRPAEKLVKLSRKHRILLRNFKEYRSLISELPSGVVQLEGNDTCIGAIWLLAYSSLAARDGQTVLVRREPYWNTHPATWGLSRRSAARGGSE